MLGVLLGLNLLLLVLVVWTAWRVEALVNHAAEPQEPTGWEPATWGGGAQGLAPPPGGQETEVRLPSVVAGDRDEFDEEVWEPETTSTRGSQPQTDTDKES